MKTEDELAAVLAHEIIHADSGQVTDRVARLAKERGISPADFGRWKVEDFGRTYMKQQELACDRDGAGLAVKAGHSPFGLLYLLQTFKLLASTPCQSYPRTKRPCLASHVVAGHGKAGFRVAGFESPFPKWKTAPLRKSEPPSYQEGGSRCEPTRWANRFAGRTGSGRTSPTHKFNVHERHRGVASGACRC